MRRQESCQTDAVTDVASAPRPRPGGRSARVVSAAHAATFELLEESGYDSLQLSDVARRAQINKTTVYRRWPTKAALVADLLVSFTRLNVAIPDTGSLQRDLEHLLSDIVAALDNRAVRAVLYGVISGALDSGDIRSAQTAFWEERFERGGALVERAIARGEVSADTDPRALLEMAAGPIYFRTLCTADPVSTSYIKDLARRAIAAWR